MRKQGEARRAAAAPAPAPEDGEAQPEAEEQQQEQQQQSGDPFELKVPEFVSAKEITEERQGFVTEFQALAPQVGIDATVAQALLDVSVDSAVALDYVPKVDADRDDARLEMETLFGDAGKNLIKRAQIYAQARGSAFQDYLDSTNLGNDPSVLVALAFAQSGYLTQTPEQAKEDLGKVMASKEYLAGDPYTMIKVQVLSRIAHRGAQSANDQLAAAAKAQAAKIAAPKPAAGAQAEGDVRAEISKLLDSKGPLLRGGPGQAEAKARYFELLKKI